MTVDPTKFVGEILGVSPVFRFDPSITDFACPFVGRRCNKVSASNPYPVCSIRRKIQQDYICVCPSRFHQIDFLTDVIDHVWEGEKPVNPKIAREVNMKGFGKVDFVISDVAENGKIGQFLSVELQAIDITGSVRDAYDAILAGQYLEKKKSYGLNWKNVYKRYINQLISKGYFHHHWQTKIVAVLQDVVYDYICEDASFMRTEDIKSRDVNIVFMSYRFADDPNDSCKRILVLDKVEGTHHSSLQSAVLYKSAPSRNEFCSRISQALNR